MLQVVAAGDAQQRVQQPGVAHIDFGGLDLALAQVAALGALAAFLIGIETHSALSYVISLLFTFFGAGVFTFTRLREKKIPQEAIIGVVYAFSAALAIIILNRSPSEAEHIKDMLVGNILFVNWREIAKMAMLYGAIGLFHYVFRKKFILISTDVEEARRQNIPIRLWDFLFYASLGFVVTSSVEIAGVLLVFSYLIAPAVCAMVLSDKLKTRLFLGWFLGAFISLAGLFVSASMDVPTGAAVVCAFGVTVFFVILYRQIFLT